MRGIDGNDRSGFLEVQVIISVLDNYKNDKLCKISKADMFVKLGGHGSNRGNDEPSKLFTKAMPIIAESQFE